MMDEMKLGRIFAVMLFVIALTACSDADGDTSEAKVDEIEVTGEAATEAERDETEVSAEDESGIEVDKGLFNVEVTLPASLFDEEELAEIEAEMREQADADMTQNDDGSITVKMSKSDHKQMLIEMGEKFIVTMDEIVEDENFATIVDIKYNNDFSNITMVVSDQESFENSLDGFATLSLGFTSLFYQAFNGKDLTKDQVTIEVVDGSTDEIIHEIFYPEALEELGTE